MSFIISKMKKLTSHKNNWYYIKNFQKETGKKTNMKSQEKYLQDLNQWFVASPKTIYMGL